MPEIPLQDVRLGDLRIAYAMAGDGPPLVLLHGAWGDSRVCRRQLDGLATDFAVTAWRPGWCQVLRSSKSLQTDLFSSSRC
ncbi:MAG: alpha/beta fold hydrolase [Gaiellaceae bacterium]